MHLACYMGTTKTFSGVSAAIFDCMRARAIAQYGTVYSPAEGLEGTATTVQMGQKVVMAFSLDAAAETLTYSIVEKGFLVPERSIWSGIEAHIAACG